MSQNLVPLPLQRSRGLKLILVCFLVLLMAIPAMFISFISYDRSSRADEVTRTVSNNYGGPQTITGPFLSVPYRGYDQNGKINSSGDYIIYADTGQAVFEDIQTDIRKLSLFRVPIFTANGTLSATFDAPRDIIPDAQFEFQWNNAQLMIALSDVRGLRKDIDMIVKGYDEVRRFEPASSHSLPRALTDASDGRPISSYGVTDVGSGHTYLSVAAGDMLVSGEALSVEVALSLGGAKNFNVRPFAKSTEVTLSSDWSDPGFVGDLPPDTRDISDAGFSAKWSVPYLRRGIRGQGEASVLSSLINSQSLMGVNFVSTSSPYKTVNRALKYSVLFIGLVFLAYFLLEILIGVPVHPAQYILIGLAQAIFYLLLLAVAEYIGFTFAFMISAGATVAVTAGYAGAVFGDRKYIARTALVFGMVYGLLFVLMKMQDFALMIGALTSFIAIAGTMYLTRRMDWYGGKVGLKDTLK